MKKILTLLLCLISFPAFAQSSAEQTVIGTLTTSSPYWNPVASTNPLPVGVYDLSNSPGDCLISNGSSSAATFQACSGGGGGSTIAIQATTTTTALHPLLAVTTGATVSTVYIDLASPLSYTPSSGVFIEKGLTLSSLTTGALTVNGTGVVASGTLANSFLTNSSMTLAGHIVSLGGTQTFACADLSNGATGCSTATGTSGATIPLLNGTNTWSAVNTFNAGDLALGSATTGVVITNGTGVQSATTSLPVTDLNGGTGATSTTYWSGAGTWTTPAGTVATPSLSLQYNNAGSIAGATGLYYNSTTLGINFLASVTTGNLISMGANGTDVTSVAVGPAALLAQTATGSDNTAVGGFALTAVTTGVKNTAYGWDAGQTITVGSSNLVLGPLVASTTLTIGSSNILLGVSSAIDATTSSESNSIHIGGTGGDWVHTTGTNVANSQVTAMAGALNTSSTSATAFTVGTAGTTTPIFAVDDSTASAVAGLALKGAATGGTVAITTTDSGSNTNLSITPKGSGTFQIGGSGIGNVTIQTNGQQIWRFGAVQVGTVGSSFFQFAPTAVSSGNSHYSFASAVDTALNTGANIPIGTIGTSGFARQHSTGSVALQSDWQFLSGINSAVGASTFTTSDTVSAVPPGCGTNATCTNVAAYYVPSLALVTTGAITNSYGLFINTASGPTNNYAAYLNGAVGVGVAQPTDELDVAGGIGLTTTTATVPTNGIYSPSAGALAVTSTGVTAISISSASLVALPQITSDATHTDAAVCEDTTTHALYSGSGTLGVCLGTSSARFKTNIRPIIEGIDQVIALKPVNFNFIDPKKGDPNKLQYGFIAEDAVRIIPNLVGVDKDGQPNTFDYVGLVPVLVRAVQDQQKEIDALAGKNAVILGHRCFFGMLVCPD